MTVWMVAYWAVAIASGVAISGWMFSHLAKKYPDDDVDEEAETLAFSLVIGVVGGAVWPVFLPFTLVLTRRGHYGWFKKYRRNDAQV